MLMMTDKTNNYDDIRIKNGVIHGFKNMILSQ